MITRQQREAIAKVFNRTTLWRLDGQDRIYPMGADWPEYQFAKKVTYRQFRRTVQRECYGDGLMVHWCGMWLGIEPDGYTHS